MWRKKYRSVQYRGLPNQRRFGVELEINNSVSQAHIRDVVSEWTDRRIRVSGWAQSRNNDYWHIKQDGTCGIVGRGYDKGWEVASFVGKGEDDIQHIGMVAQALANSGCEVNENCGLHVHVEATDFDAYQMGILLGHYAKWESTLLGLLPLHRALNPYCENFRELFDGLDRYAYWSAPEMWLYLKPKNHQPHENPYRWRSINLVNFSLGLLNPNWNRKTIEFRLPECSLVDYDVKNWIRLFVNFVEWARHQDMPANIYSEPFARSLEHMGLGHDNNAFCIFGRELFSTKTWLLRRWLRMQKGVTSLLVAPKKILNEMWQPVRNFS